MTSPLYEKQKRDPLLDLWDREEKEFHWGSTCFQKIMPTKPFLLHQGPPRSRLRAFCARCDRWLNGARVLACDLASEDFRRRVSNSKFSYFPQFARAAEGHIVLQHHATDAWFRDIRISTTS